MKWTSEDSNLGLGYKTFWGLIWIIDYTGTVLVIFNLVLILVQELAKYSTFLIF
jgi:hypothetical protein